MKFSGINQCGDFFDEEHCTTQCKKGEYFCHPKGCLSSDKFCDGIVDCYNAFDEEGCLNSSSTSKPNDKEQTHPTERNITRIPLCGPHEFQCSNLLECIPIAMRCDSFQDCFDR